ncbi:MAG: WYL domain-containing protein [Cyclobacteriaceae bacterium]|nr:WYL domain-containing protein [Cyclobacteriaceae bacterium]
MSVQATIRRYALIIEKTRKDRYPSSKEIRAFLYEHGLAKSERTLQRDIETIRDDFGVEIAYDHRLKGYHIDKENSRIDTSSFMRLIDIVNTATVILEGLRQSKETLNYLAFDGGQLTGVENLKDLLFAIQNNRKVGFTHHSFHTGKDRDYTFRPYLLKEYQNRWYVVGILGTMTEFRTLGLDRLSNLKVLAETFKRDPKANPATLFEDTVGLTYSEHEKERVILSFTAQQGKYAKTLPFHSSQEILKDDEKELQVAIEVTPNYELMQKILMHGETVRVISPEWLVKKIQKMLRKAAERYEGGRVVEK